MSEVFGKYIISKRNGERISEKAKYFVLRYDEGTKDVHAVEALRYYASLNPDSALSQALLADLPEAEDE